MQKQVSKQSLAIVALSILLAICMALTATYAAFSASKTVSGTITFTAPQLTITNNVTFVDDAESEIDDVKIGDNVVAALKGKLAAGENSNMFVLTLRQGDFSYGYDAGLPDDPEEEGDQSVQPFYTLSVKSSIVSALESIQFTVTGNSVNPFQVTTTDNESIYGSSGLVEFTARNTDSSVQAVTFNFAGNASNSLLQFATITEEAAGESISITIAIQINANYITVA